MVKHSDGMTPRQRQSQQIMREKAAMKKRKALMRKCWIVGGGLSCIILCGGSVWMWKTGTFTRTAQAVSGEMYGLTAKAGFSLQALYLEGRSRTAMGDIEQALGIRKGEPILQLSLPEMRARLEAVESIKYAAVERALPGTLYVRIVEREPVAIWQYNNKLALVDDKGTVMSDLDPAPYSKLPLIVGEDAPKHVSELISILTAAPDLSKRFAAAIYVGDRRWNIRMSSSNNGSDIEVKLPEDHAAEAWKKLAELQSKEQVLERDIKVIDLRLEGRMFIKLSPELVSGKSSSARET